jgi:8-oxo-dGTP pyrophosphatase MutT (NUDIX family)
MGAGILPTCIHKNKLYFLFGKENKFADTPGFAEFGGGNDKNENHFETAVREGTEELTGFLGSEEELRKILKRYGTYNIDWNGSYRTHIFPMSYDPYLPHYYNNNQRFLQRKLPAKLIKDSKIFEKAEIKWFCVDDLLKERKSFRSYYQNIVDMIYEQREQIYLFISKAKCNHKNNRNHFKKTKTNRNKYNKTFKNIKPC